MPRPRSTKLRPLDFESAPFAPKYYDSKTDGAAVLLLHGTFGSTASNFGLIFQSLSARFRVIGLDFQEPEGELELTDLVEQASALVEGQELSQVHCVGYSLGAVVAAAFASTYPAQVDRLVLLAGWQSPDHHLLLRNDIWHALRRSEDDTALSQFTTLSATSPEFLASLSPAQLKATLNSLRFTSFGDKQMRLNRGVDISALTPKIEASTLVLSCEQDAMIPPHHQKQLAASIPHAQLKTLCGGHGIVFEDPDAVSREILEFL